MNDTIDEELISNRSVSTRITGSLTRPQGYSVGPSHADIIHNNMEVFLSNISPDLRRIV
jgi:hypothetical protein